MIINFGPPAPVQAGDLLLRQKASGLGFHYGTGVGSGYVAHTTPAIGKHVGTLDEFAERKPVTIIRPMRTPVQNSIVEHVALSDLGNPYHWAAANCEHDVYRIHAGNPQSPTVDGIKLVGASALLIVLITSFTDKN